jgi:hypothetical protein
MGIAIYMIVEVFLGFYWMTHSVYFGYTGHKNLNMMRGPTIIFAMLIWPAALVGRFIAKRIQQ